MNYEKIMSEIAAQLDPAAENYAAEVSRLLAEAIKKDRKIFTIISIGEDLTVRDCALWSEHYSYIMVDYLINNEGATGVLTKALFDKFRENPPNVNILRRFNIGRDRLP